MPPVLVALSGEEVKLARKLSDRIAKTPTMTLRNYTGLSMADRYFNGFLGEIAMKRWLEGAGVNHEWKPKTDGKSHAGDFTVYRKGQPLKLDVKTASKGYYTKCMFPEVQFRAHRVDIYVCARVNTTARLDAAEAVELHGWKPFRDVVYWNLDADSLAIPTRWEYLSELHPMAELAAELDQRRGE